MTFVHNVFLSARTARDIDLRIARVLKDLGNSQPPLRLEPVRELLRLDRRYYSSTDQGVLREVSHRLRVAGKQVFARPSLLLEAVQKFDLRALFLPDRRRILLDATLPDAKQRWSEAHEIGHSLIDWHADTMFGDTRHTLTPSCQEQIEAEANYAAGQLLFLQELFVRDARDLDPGIEAVLALKKRYENTITTTLWKYVEQSDLPLIGGISDHPLRPGAEFQTARPFRYFIVSRRFVQAFSKTKETDIFRKIQRYCENRRGGPLGSAEVILADDSGIRHLFQFDTFFNRYDALTLGVHRGEVPRVFAPQMKLINDIVS